MNNVEFDQFLAETEKLIDRLHALYELWFQGVERRPPTKQRELLDKRLAGIRSNLPRNTALRFRSQTILQRWVTMTHHWNKVTKQIEEGTYYRDVQRAKRRAAERDAKERVLEQRRAARNGAAQPGAQDAAVNSLEGWTLDESELDDAFDRMFDDTASFVTASHASMPAMPAPAPAPAARAAPQPAPPPVRAAPQPAPPPVRAAPQPAPPPVRAAPQPAQPPPAAPARASGDIDYQAVYSAFVDARKRNNERVDTLKFETVVATIEKQLPDLKKKHAGKAIDFEVVVKDGRVGLKPIAR